MAARWGEAAEFDPAPPEPVRTLSEAHSIITGARRESYGHPLDNHTTTAEFFRAYLARRYGVDLPLDAEDIVWFNVCQKVSREAFQRKYDNHVDVAGYVGNLEQIENERRRRDSSSAKTDSRD